MKKYNNDLVPKLRFPKFRDSGEWEIKKLIEICAFINEKISLNQISINNYISTENILPNYEGITRASKLPQTNSVAAFQKEDILLSNIRPYLKKIWYSNISGGVSNDVIIIRTKKNYIPIFIAFLLKNDRFIAYIMKSAKGLKMPRGEISLIKEYLLTLPTLEEQQKIADCLSSLDEIITAENEKLTLLKTYKKGLMQKLFPSEGERVPKLRFPEFRDSGEWEEKTINDLGEIVTGKTPSTSDLSLWNGDIQFVTPTDIAEEKYQINTQRTVVNNSNIKVLPKNSIMFTCIASIGKMALSVHPCITNQQINTVIPCSLYNNEFIYYVLLKKSYFIKSKLANTTLPIINKSEFSKFSIIIPNDKKEQQKIADCLSSLDELINAQDNKIKKLKEHKKGLMQGLFPSASDIEKGEHE